ncbi:MAG: uroporphyrinogen-III C-methyltransferase [Phycisphaerae bacterium]|nr:uroporphyrinogen-III C-methyltransferase [Phycisphaerae bacterium]
MLQGKVYLVGAGPGDVELITLKGYRLICQADVLLYDHLIPLQLIELARPDAEKISVGKFAGRHTIPQSEINKLLIEKASGNKTIVRLKGGDPYLFGRGGEEAEACVDAGIEFEAVPGVTSALAVPSYAGIPPTHRDYTSNVAIVTGHRKEQEQIEIPNAGTIIFLMGVSNIGKIVDSLLKNNWPAKTKIAAIEHGTCYNQRIITGDLENFVEKVREANLQPPAIFIVGKVAELEKKLNWFTKKNNILVLGNYPQKYAYLGNIVHRRIIDCVPLDDYSQVDKLLQQDLDTFEYIVFTSMNGVKYFFERLFSIGKDARALASTKIAAIGQTTGQSLKGFGVGADVVAENESSLGLLEKFAKFDMKNKKVLLPQSQIASQELPDGLFEMGAVIKKMPVYKTVDIEPQEIDFEYIDRILFTSGSTVRAFVKRFGGVPANLKCWCLGLPTLNEAKKHNIDAEIVPDKPTQRNRK